MRATTVTAVRFPVELDRPQPVYLEEPVVVFTLEELRELVVEVVQQATRTCLATLTTTPPPADPPAPEPLPDGWPLVELVTQRRAELCLSLGEVVRRMHHAAKAEQDHCSMTRQALSRVERHHRIPHPANLRWLAVALELSAGQVTTAARQQRHKRDHHRQATEVIQHCRSLVTE